jgi:hypothetical protein
LESREVFGKINETFHQILKAPEHGYQIGDKLRREPYRALTATEFSPCPANGDRITLEPAPDLWICLRARRVLAFV